MKERKEFDEREGCVLLLWKMECATERSRFEMEFNFFIKGRRVYLAEKKNGYSNSHLGIVRVKPTKQFICPKIVNFIFCLNGLVNTDGVFNRDESVWNESEKH